MCKEGKFPRKFRAKEGFGGFLARLFGAPDLRRQCENVVIKCGSSSSSLIMVDRQRSQFRRNYLGK